MHLILSTTVDLFIIYSFLQTLLQNDCNGSYETELKQGDMSVTLKIEHATLAGHNGYWSITQVQRKLLSPDASLV